MKVCIWCKEKEGVESFNKLAHTIPQSLGGKNICENVCDACNSYFGNYDNGLPPVESAFKETFMISRTLLLYPIGEIGRNKALARPKSAYFNVDLVKKSIALKQPYKFNKDFQEILARQLKRGILKVYLEERERQFGDALTAQFDLIRRFSRHNQGDLPLLYFTRKFGILVLDKEKTKSPEIPVDANKLLMKYLQITDHYFEFELLGHCFSIPYREGYNSIREEYLKGTAEIKKDVFEKAIPVKRIFDIDLTLRVLQDPIIKG